ncbi:MAG: leucine--tRNA ligase [Bacteroidia bacterium]|nr:leucine--tRNA ligase [Bacteroidia bacterium]
MNYKHEEIEAKWQRYWAANKSFRVVNSPTDSKKSFYVLDMFPYPSGAGLHVGHPLGYIASDIVARYKRHCGFAVLHPMGYDSFGLPAEQYAIQTGQHPAKTTEENIARYRAQLDKIGFSFDWEREVRTSDPEYYKWTQWIFLQLFNAWYNPINNKAENVKTLIAHFESNGTKGIECDRVESFTASQWGTFSEQQQLEILMNFRLAYLSDAFVNWCPALGTVLANDEVKDGLSERGGFPVERKKMKQWSMRITAYSERLLQDLDGLDWNENIKEIQRNWIGKSEGCSIRFSTEEGAQIEVFTTRPDTLFGVSYLTLAPEHELIHKIVSPAQKEKVDQYIAYTKTRSERERQSDVKKITGEFTGAYAIHPFSGERIPIWVGEYVLAGYGTGAVMAVPAHDERDFAFAKYFHLPIKQVITTPQSWDILKEPWCEKQGQAINSDFLNGLDVNEAIQTMIENVVKKGLGEGKTNYRLRDAAFGRQRYWGEPIPVYFKDGMSYPIADEHLPLILPEIDSFLPTENGEPPLGRATRWNYNPQRGVVANGEGYPIELTTMPGWAGSSWYFFRYMDAQNKTEFASTDALSRWKQVDFYVGGAEHATGHLLYARFWTKFLFDMNFVQIKEPFQKMLNQGMILGESAFCFRVENEKKFVSKNQVGNLKVRSVRVDLSVVNDLLNELDIERMRQHPLYQEFKDFEFLCEPNGKFIVEREVEKMSKSKYNVVNPDDICREYGADTLRLYEMFLGPIEDAKPWSTKGIEGVYKFLKKLWRLFYNENGSFYLSNEKPSEKELKTLHKTIKKVSGDIESLSFNTSVSAFMICVNELQDLQCNKRQILEPLLILLSPFAPHVTEELWEQCGHEGGISTCQWPEFKEEYLTESSIAYPVSINGKTRVQITLPATANQEQVQEAVLANEIVIKWMEGKPVRKFIFVPGKIVNVVI